ncbi:major facilitator superfamily domain-containing protein [Cladochytrium replicatum]|nr:major facilitator superfamily domain-containing protein [Cladochytrium replicatum]
MELEQNVPTVRKLRIPLTIQTGVQFTSEDVKRLITIITACLMMSTSGSMFSYPSISSSLLRRLSGFDQTALTTVSTLGNTALYIAFLPIGPLHDRLGPRPTALLAALLYSGGYLMMYLGYVGWLPGTQVQEDGRIEGAGVTVVAIGFYYFVAGCGSCASYMAALGPCMANAGSRRSGLISGILLLFYGLSATFYAQIYFHFFTYPDLSASGATDDAAGFLLFTAISVFVSNLLGVFGLFIVPRVATPTGSWEGVEFKSTDNVRYGPDSHPVIELRWKGERDHKIGDVERLIEQGVFVLDNEVDDSKDNLRMSQSSARDKSDLVLLGSVERTSSLSLVYPIPPTIDDIRPSQAGSSASIAIRASRAGTPLTSKPAQSFKLEDDPEAGLSPLQILKAPIFWLFTSIFIAQQGLTYLSNVSSILSAVLPPSENLASHTSLHVTILSVFQSIARFGFGLLADLLANHPNPRFHPDRSVLLVLSESLLLVPGIVLGVAGAESTWALTLCSVCVGTGWGAGGSLFALLTRDFFGAKWYGTACGYVMAAVPVGILASNAVYGMFFDSESTRQMEMGIADGDVVRCVGSVCYRKAFVVSLAIQILPVLLAAAIFVLRTIKKKTVVES